MFLKKNIPVQLNKEQEVFAINVNLFLAHFVASPLFVCLSQCI